MFCIAQRHRPRKLEARVEKIYEQNCCGITKRKDIFYRKCPHITVTCNTRREVEFDGDPRGFLPVEIKILPQALNLIGAEE